MSALPTGTVTFLFTDLEGSTRLWQEHPEAMQPALARHDEIVRGAIESHGGFVVKTTGDGAHAAFATASDAVDAAVAAQLAIEAEAWTLPEPLRVRMGIHTGPAELRDGDYYGTAVNRAARIMSIAHGGQIVVSQASREVLGEVEVDLVDLGEHRLKDLGQRERIFQVVHGELRGDFPPLRSIDAFAGNLPLQATSFVGRDDDVRSIADALRTTRLLTVTGVGGVGKTRLAIQVAAELLPAFPDGAWLCELAAANDAEALVQVVAATLGVQPRAGASLEASIVEFLRTRAALVVLDNCEHLLDAAAELAEDVLAQCPDVRLLATSREGLAVAGEQVWPLRSLRMPKVASTDAAFASAAVQLFTERARAASPDFVLDERNATTVLEVCRRLDGIPLAIELAASRMGSMSPGEVADLLDERFRLLTGGRRNAVERHQTLRATVDWSYSLLGDTDRRVFDRLGVFSGTFDAAAAAAVVAGDGVEAWDVRDALAGLVGRSMLVAEPGEGGVTRYGMLETLRHYARERLDETGDADGWRRSHATYFERLAEELGLALKGPDEMAARARLVADLDNLRAGYTWALDSPDPADVELGVGILAGLAPYASVYLGSGIVLWGEPALPHLAATSPARRVSVLGVAAWARLTCRADPDGAAVLAREAVAHGIPPGTSAPVTSFTALSLVHMMRGEYGPAVDAAVACERALDAGETHPWDRSILLSVWSNHLTLVAGHDVEARAKADDALAIARGLRNPSALAFALFATALVTQGPEPEVALAAVEESIALTRSGAFDGAYGAALVIAAWLRASAGDLAGALLRSREAIEYSRRVGDLNNGAYALRDAVNALAVHDEQVAAAEILGAVEGGGLQAIVVQTRGAQTDRFEAGRRAVEAGLGADEFAAAWSQGAAMTVDDATTRAIAALDRILAREEGT